MIKKIISGGQTGVDRAALDFALENGINCGGWCPKGRIAEDGIIPEYYPLSEKEKEIYEERTEKNVEDSDGTLILNNGFTLRGGTLYTYGMLRKHDKPVLVLNLNDIFEINFVAFSEWLLENNIETLNIAGNRESETPGIYEQAKMFLIKLIII
ncbi:MAG: putative molybdenum carrier protein [Bacteroidia bacterium]